MKFSTQKPPNWARLEKAFNVRWGGSLVVAYGDTIHHTEKLDSSVIVHEQVHLFRQSNDSFAFTTRYADKWWESYIRDPKFRFEEELLAYREQYKFLKDTVKDRNELARHSFRLASDLSGPMYALPISHREALKLIRME